MTDLKITPEELATIEEERDWWKEVEKAIPAWRLHGWTYKYVSSFIDSNDQVFTLTDTQRNDIVTAFVRERLGG